MKKFQLLFLTLIVCLFAIPAFAQKIDTFGYYFIENPTKAFAGISEINIAGDAGLKEKPKFYGLVRMKKKSAKDYRLLKPALTGRNISFTTQTVGGIYYKFVGTFRRSFPADIQTRMDKQVEGTVLAGTLTKYQNGKKFAEAKVNFSYSGGD
jgi:hypothetical protein